ncbi:MAG: MFS transporter [Gammaproteobacteria bacterium]
MPERFRSPEYFLLLMAAAVSLAFSIWRALLNNFAIEQVGFTGVEIGVLQSLREVPGFLAFTTVFVLLVLREQTFAVLATATLGLGVALTGLLPTEYGLYFTTVLMSVGFHYHYTVQQSLTLQWLPRDRAPIALGRQSATASVAALVAFGGIWLAVELAEVPYLWIYLVGGSVTVILAMLAWRLFPGFSHAVPQHKHLVLRRRYGLFYALTFMSGARRQIFVVFAGFLMVEKFGYSAADIAALFLINHVINTFLAPRIGHLISHWGERRVLIIEYMGLIGVFCSYALVERAEIAATLYVVDHLLFAMAIGINTYFQKIADPADIASTASVSFTINHIAAVVIPAAFGLIWVYSHAAVFFAGATMAAGSLVLALLLPRTPSPGNETVWRSRLPDAATREARASSLS